MAKLQDADAIIVLGAQPSREHGVVAAKIRTTVRRRGAKLLIFHTRKSDLDQYADICANVVSLERTFWDQVAEVVAGRAAARAGVRAGGDDVHRRDGAGTAGQDFRGENRRPGADALIAVADQPQQPALAAAGIEPVEEVGPWLGAKPLEVPADRRQRRTGRRGAFVATNDTCGRCWTKLIASSCRRATSRALTDLAQVVLPAAIWCEKQGTITNFEGRELPLQAVLPPRGEARQDLAILETVLK